MTIVLPRQGTFLRPSSLLEGASLTSLADDGIAASRITRLGWTKEPDSLRKEWFVKRPGSKCGVLVVLQAKISAVKLLHSFGSKVLQVDFVTTFCWVGKMMFMDGPMAVNDVALCSSTIAGFPSFGVAGIDIRVGPPKEIASRLKGD